MLEYLTTQRPEVTMPFRLEHITLAERLDLGCTLVLCAGQYGLVSELAQDYATSRQFLYTLRAKAQVALASALAAGTAGRPRLDQRLVVDHLAVERAILVLNQVTHASVRAIQESLAQILRVERSLGMIHGILAQAGCRARQLRVIPDHAVDGVADEIFAAHRPVLEVVEPQSGAVLCLTPTPARDETAWGCTLLDLIDPGVTIAHLTADGALGMRAGARAVGLAEPHLDHWHTLRDLGRLAQVLEHTAYRSLARAERTQQAAAAEAYRRAHGRRPQRGRPLQAASDPASVQQATAEEEEAVRRADGVAIVLAAVREILPPVDRTSGRLHRSDGVRADLGAAVALLRDLGGRATEAASLLEHRAPGLVAYFAPLEAQLREPRAVLGEDVVDFLAWAWHYRHALALTEAAEAWPTAPDRARQVWTALDQAVRATGMVENLNSILAPHRAAHRGLPANVLSVFAVYRNHHVFARGKRADHSPLELLGLPAPDWLDALGYGRAQAATVHELPDTNTKTVSTLVA
jgi:hypothetical protein